MTPSSLPPRLATRIAVQASGCWEWTGTRKETGYGRIEVAGRIVHVHRHVYELLVGPVPAELEVDHLCRNRPCCNPAHLEPVTHRENTRRARAAVTSCPRGHAYDEANTYTNRGRRFCRACANERGRAQRAARKAVAA